MLMDSIINMLGALQPITQMEVMPCGGSLFPQVRMECQLRLS